MKNSELKEYLDRFPDDADVAIIMANPKERKRFEFEGINFITDLEMPVFCITVGQAIDMDAEMIEGCEDSGAGFIERFLEFVDGHSKAVDDSYDKTYTLEELEEYIPFFVRKKETYENI